MSVRKKKRDHCARKYHSFKTRVGLDTKNFDFYFSVFFVVYKYVYFWVSKCV